MSAVRTFGLVVLTFLAGGCFGGSPSATSSPVAPSESGIVAPAGLDAATKERLLAEWRVAVKTAGGFGPGSLAFLTPSQLVPILKRVNPAIPATTSLNATMSLDDRVVFVLSDSTSRRLDIATAARSGRYVHLIAVGAHRPRFQFGAL